MISETSPAMILVNTERFVRDCHRGDASGHDWWHIDRVRRTAMHIARAEGAELYVVELAALLHDVADWKFRDGDETAGPREARLWLESQHARRDDVDHVCAIVEHVSFKGANVASQVPPSLEGCVVQDADRLDAMGAIGIARAFAYGGRVGRDLHDPARSPELHASFAAYKRNNSPTINHFHEKLLLLKDRLHTATGRKLAERRHRVMESFLAEFHREWNGAEDLDGAP